MAASRAIALMLTCALAACTPGGTTPGGTIAAPVSNATVIDVSLSAYAASSTSAGNAGGFSPAVTSVAVGSQIRFTNTDSFAHTASSFSGSVFPSSSPLTSAALNTSGNTLSGGWSTGALQAGQSSQTITVDKAGTYLYGCFYHYGAPMRGEIVAF